MFYSVTFANCMFISYKLIPRHIFSLKYLEKYGVMGLLRKQDEASDRYYLMYVYYVNNFLIKTFQCNFFWSA